MLCLAVTGWAAQRAGTPIGSALVYAGYFAGCVALPGVLLLRAFAPGRRNWAEDIGLGIPVGLAYELVGWVLFTALGAGRLQLVWALAVPVVFLAVPRLRRCWRADSVRLPWLWHAAVAGLAAVAVAFWYGLNVQRTAVPPHGGVYYPDLLWHLALVQETERSVPPQVPQVAGDTLKYHWFADAHMASAAHITGLDPRLIVFRLWFAPLLVALVLGVAALARQVSGVWWTAPAAVAASVVAIRVGLWDYTGVVPVGPTYFFSPSQTYGSTLAVGLAALLLAVLYGRAPARSWALVVLVACASAGSKPTTIPVLLGATGLAAAFLLVRNRRPHWPTVATGAGLLVVLAAATATVTGSTAGTAVRLLGAMRIMPGYIAVTGDTTYPVPHGWGILDGLEDPSGRVLTWAGVTLLGLVVAMAVSVLPLLTLVTRRTRTDPVHWWLVGAVIAGWLGFLLVDHPGGAEYYFLGGVIPFAAVSVAALAASGLRGRAPGVRRTVLVSCLLAAVVVTAAIRWFGNVGSPPAETDGDAVTDAVGRPLLWFGVAVAVAVACWFMLRVRRPAVRGLGIAVVAAVVLGLVVAGRTPYEWKDALVRARQQPFAEAAAPVTPAENAAADWVEHNVPELDVVAADTACVLPRKPGTCRALGYLVSGIGGRRVFLEGWAYTSRSMEEQRPDTRYLDLPTPWPDRLELTQRAITHPTPAVLAELRSRGVRWLFVDSRQSPPDTAELGRLADRRYDDGTVQIYRLR